MKLITCPELGLTDYGAILELLHMYSWHVLNEVQEQNQNNEGMF